MSKLNFNAVPDSRSRHILIGLHSTTGSRQLNEAGYTAEHLRGGGHFGLILLDIRYSTASVYDSLNESFDQSSYFLSEKIKMVVTGMHDKFRSEQNRDAAQLQWDQPVTREQYGNDCGVHLLTTAELVMRGLDPAKQEFTKKAMEIIRLYHVLLKEEEVPDLRITYLD